MSVTLRPTTLNRLRQLFAQAEGARAAAQAAVDAHTQLAQRLDVLLTDACEDQGMTIPADRREAVQIDWDTGEVSFKDAQLSNGHVPQEALA